MVWMNFLLGVLTGITVAHIFVMLLYGRDAIIMKPSDIGDLNDINMFGKWIIYIILAIFSPVVFIFKLFYILTHIRR